MKLQLTLEPLLGLPHILPAVFDLGGQFFSLTLDLGLEAGHLLAMFGGDSMKPL